MTLQSLSLLDDLRKLPVAEGVATLSHDETVARMRGMDRNHFAIEVSQATEEAMEALFKARNVPDVLREAYPLAFTNSNQSLHEHYQEVMEGSPSSVVGFVSNLKGKVAELRVESALEGQYPDYDFNLAESVTQPGWDLIGTSPDGPDIFIQVKTGAEEYADDVVDAMREHPKIAFLVSTEVYDRIAESHPELLVRLGDIGSNAVLTEEVRDGLGKLAGNLGVDVPDTLADLLPIAAEVALGIKLILGVVKTERELSGVDLPDRSRVHGIRTLALASRFGINQVCMWAGSAGGAVAGTAVPGVGNVAGGLAGGLAGIGSGMLLNRLLQPRIEEVAMKLIGGDADDIFYLMNKVEIDQVGQSLAATRVA